METIGDAYMVAGGLPEATPDHARFVARMALDMIAAASDVPSPATGQPLQVGVHYLSVFDQSHRSAIIIIVLLHFIVRCVFARR